VKGGQSPGAGPAHQHRRRYGPAAVQYAGAIGQFEIEIRAKRQMDGIQKAKERGVAFGRKKKLTPAQVAQLREKRKGGALIKELMREYNLSKATVYRYLEASAA
jgi:DNA invertase Pin-like site-specific DNA recombinase